MDSAGHAISADQLYSLVADMWRRMPKASPETIASAVLASAGMNPEDNPVCYAAALQTLVVMAMDVEDELGSSSPSYDMLH